MTTRHAATWPWETPRRPDPWLCLLSSPRKKCCFHPGLASTHQAASGGRSSCRTTLRREPRVASGKASATNAHLRPQQRHPSFSRTSPSDPRALRLAHGLGGPCTKLDEVKVLREGWQQIWGSPSSRASTHPFPSRGAGGGCPNRTGRRQARREARGPTDASFPPTTNKRLLCRGGVCPGRPPTASCTKHPLKELLIVSTICPIPPFLSSKPSWAANESAFIHWRCFCSCHCQRLVDGRALVSRSCICVDCVNIFVDSHPPRKSSGGRSCRTGSRVHLQCRLPCCRSILACAM